MMIHKQILEALYVISIGDNPIATRAGDIAIMAVKVCCPEEILCFSSPVIFEKKVALQR